MRRQSYQPLVNSYRRRHLKFKNPPRSREAEEEDHEEFCQLGELAEGNDSHKIHESSRTNFRKPNKAIVFREKEQRDRGRSWWCSRRRLRRCESKYKTYVACVRHSLAPTLIATLTTVRGEKPIARPTDRGYVTKRERKARILGAANVRRAVLFSLYSRCKAILSAQRKRRRQAKSVFILAQYFFGCLFYIQHYPSKHRS